MLSLESRAVIIGVEATLAIIVAHVLAVVLTPIVSSWCLKHRHQFLRRQIAYEKRTLVPDLWRARSGVAVWVIVSTTIVLFFSTGSILLGSVLLMATVVADQGVTIWGVRTTLLP